MDCYSNLAFVEVVDGVKQQTATMRLTDTTDALHRQCLMWFPNIQTCLSELQDSIENVYCCISALDSTLAQLEPEALPHEPYLPTAQRDLESACSTALSRAAVMSPSE